MEKIDKQELHVIFDNLINNNKEEFGIFFNKYKKIIYGIAFSILKNKIDSEEIVQIVFMKIISLEKSKLPTTNEATWLYTLTKNETLNYLRKKRKETSIDNLYYISDDNDELSKIIDEDKYNRIISNLNEKEKEIVSLKVISKFSFKEISQILDIPMGTVQWKYYKAINTLKILISNLSLFIITTLILAKRRLVSGNKKEELEREEVKQENVIVEIPTKEETEKVKGNEQLNKDETMREQVNNKVQQETLKGQESTIIETNNIVSNNVIDIGIFSIWTIFLITTTFFIIIFIKNQQKIKKKVSK